MADRQRPDDDLTRGPGAKPTRPPTTAVPAGLASTIAPGQLLGHTYRIESLLARGGMGEVYRARHAELNTEHAIKIILPELAGNQRIVDLFRREASVLRTIRHDAIVAYDGVFRDENARLYLVMEFVDGPSLSKVMKQGGLRAAQVRELRDRLADGLAAAHEKGVIHRDLSPDNVILPGGELAKAKIIDFGISKMADPEQKTIVGDDFAGKFSYVSPEQLGMFGGQVDARSDIYSLGLVLAAAAQGEPLDMGQSPISVIEARRAVPDLGRVPAGVRADLAAMLQPDPAQRPQSMRQLIRTQEQRGGRKTAASERARPSSGKQGSGPMMAILGALAVLVVAAGGGGYWYWQSHSRQDDTTKTDGGSQTGGNGTASTGETQVASTTGQTQTTTSGTAAQETGTGATATQQQAATGSPSSSTGAATAGSQQASGSDETTSAASGTQSAGATQTGSAAATTDGAGSSSQTQQTTTTVATTGGNQTTGSTASGTTAGQQQASSETGSGATTTQQEAASTTATASSGNQAATQTQGAGTATSSTGTAQTTGTATSAGTDASANNKAAGSGTSTTTGTAATNTQTALLPQVPDVAKLRKEAARAVQGLSCAGVRIDVSDAGRIAVAGYVASEADRAAAAERLAALSAGGQIDNAVAVIVPPLCQVLDLLRTQTAFDRGAPGIDPGGAAGIYREGDHIKVAVTAPATSDGYVYLDSIEAEGRTVIHLLPNTMRRINRVKAGEKVVVGTQSDEFRTYEINRDPTNNIFIAVFTKKPLYEGTRPLQEGIEAYLPFLQQSLQQAAARDGPDGLASAYTHVLFNPH